MDHYHKLWRQEMPINIDLARLETDLSPQGLAKLEEEEANKVRLLRDNA